MPVPEGVDSMHAEAVVVNGLTAWRMLHRSAHVSAGQTIVVLGANSGVGSTLVHMARHDGTRVIGTAARAHHEWLRELGVTPIDRHTTDVPAQVRVLAPDGVGLRQLRRTWHRRLVEDAGPGRNPRQLRHCLHRLPGR
ncbi:MAG: hypothetical protein M3069_01455 [Chloroflexota bacterium]|nr:hypothetical protein [Chloroflexota bacterium]